MIKQTPLFEEHKALGGRIVEFAGWSMPVQYKGLKEEHHCVRQNVGLFDVSHMGEIRFQGPKALESLQWLTTNDVSILKPGQAQYSLLPNSQGGLVDDIIVYCLEEKTDYMVCVNAANKDKDFEWMKAHNKGAQVTDESGLWSQIAVQGPKATELIERVLGLEVKNLKPFHFAKLKFQGAAVIFATTGYTGEKGGEIFIENSKAVELWRTLLEKGKDLQVQPIGLGARDTLRTEMKYSLYGHEIDDTTNPFEAGLGWAVKPAAKDFVGKGPMIQGREAGLKKKLVGLKLKDKGIPRQGYKVGSPDQKEIGVVTSGTLSPSLDQSIGIAYVATPYAAIGSSILIDIRGRWVAAEVCETPFVVTALKK